MRQPKETSGEEPGPEGRNHIHLVPHLPAGVRKGYQEKPENRETVSLATMDYLQKFEKDLAEIDEWLLSVRPLIQVIGEGHKQGDQTARRLAQNSLWQNFREVIWQKKLILKTQNFQGSAEDQKEQAVLLEKWEREINRAESPYSKNGEPKMPAIKDLAQTLYRELEQHWLTENLPEDLYKFPFRISVWMERIGKAKATLQKILKQVEVIKI